MTRLLIDQFKRSRQQYVGCAAWTAAMWLFPPDYFSARWVLSWSLFMSFLAGPGLSLRAATLRELGVLPISWPDRWRSQWVLAVVVPVVITTLGALGGFAIAGGKHPQRSADLILLSALCNTAYVGFSAGLLTSMRRRRSSNKRSNKPVSRRVLNLLTVLISLKAIAGAFAGFLLYPVLPTSLAALRGVTGVVIALGVATVVWTFFRWSSLGARPALFALVRTGASPPPSTVNTPPTPATTPLTSAPPAGSATTRLFLLVVRKACLSAVVLAASAAVISPFTGPAIGGTIWITVAFLVGAADWQHHQLRDHLRALRLLPLSTTTLNLALLAPPVAFWSLTWALMTIAIWLLPSRFGVLPLLPILSVLMGFSVLAEAVRLRRSKLQFALFIAGVMVIGYALKGLWIIVPALPVAPTITVLGVCGVAVAGLLNHHTLTRSSSVYTPQPALALASGAPLQN